ncbi:MAG: adenosylhomocysteinase [Clostridia bacterium]|nr:adenosylhomocysteinase [Clostridia bacterium]
MSVIKDKSLKDSGYKKIDWVKRHMPLLNSIEQDFIKEKPLDGLNVSISIHVEAKTAYMAEVLAAGGANVTVTGCNPLSTQDDVAAALYDCGMEVYAVHGVSDEEYFKHIGAALDTKPSVFIDDGGDLVEALHGEKRELADSIWGGSEETTTGVMRLRAKEKAGRLLFPMISANDAMCKHLFDNRYGTGQSVWDGINRTTNLIVAGKNVVVAGYGWCGRGCAMRAKGMGAKVFVCEIDAVKAIEAVMDGFEVLTMDEAAEIGDVFVTVTGCKDVITKHHFEKMKNGAIMANAGHFDVEISKPDLEALSSSFGEIKPNITEYKIGGKSLYLLAEGRLVNLAAGDGHPAEIMDMSFAIQTMSVRYLAKNHAFLENRVYLVPPEIDEYVARLKLKTWGKAIDSLTPEQKEYISK